MKLFVPVVAALTLSAASLAVTASVTEADMLGKPAQASAAQRTISIDPKTRWITVERGEIVNFVANGREFAWDFDGMYSTFDLKPDCAQRGAGSAPEGLRLAQRRGPGRQIDISCRPFRRRPTFSSPPSRTARGRLSTKAAAPVFRRI